MKEYDWRNEREKYQPEYNKQAEVADEVNIPVPEPAEKSKMPLLLSILIAALVVIAAAWILISRQDSSSKLAAIAEKYQRAVGAVIVSVEFKDGAKQSECIGTAWAFSEDRFATNCHVAYGIKSACNVIFEKCVYNLIKNHAAKNKCGSVEEYLKKLGPAKAEAVKLQAAKLVLSAIKDIRADIAINGSRKQTLQITHVQTHTKYGVAGSSFNPDIAVFTVRGKHDCFFKLADTDVLHSLKSGMPIAFLGFPIEGLLKDNVNIENPVASMQSGIIVAVSDFDMKDAGAENNYLIRHNLPATGGASGSPIFNTDGEVVALLFAGNITGQIQLESGKLGRAPSAAQINFGVRVDLISGMGQAVTFKEFIK